MATSGRGVRKAAKLGRAYEQDQAPSDTPQGPVDGINLVAQVTGWAPEDCVGVLQECDGDEQAAINAIIEGTAEAWKKVESKRTKPAEKPAKAPSYYKNPSDKTSRPPKADKTDGEHTDTYRDGKPDRRRSGNPRGDRPKRPVGSENGSRPTGAQENHTAPQKPGENAQATTQTPAHPVNVTNQPSPPTPATHTAPTEATTSNAGTTSAGAGDTNTTASKAPGAKPQRAWDQSRTWGAPPRSSSPNTHPRERNLPPRQQNQANTQNQTPTPQPTETQTPAQSAAQEKAPAPTQTSQPPKPAQSSPQQNHAPAPSVAAVPTTQPKVPSPTPVAAPTPAAATTPATAPAVVQQTQPQQPQTHSPQQTSSRYSPAQRQSSKSGQTTTTWKPKDTSKAPSSQGGSSPATTPQTAPSPAAVAPPQKPVAAQPVQPVVQQAQPAPVVHQTQAPAVSQARYMPVVLPPTADVTAANIHLQFGSISGLGSAPEVNKGIDYDQQRYGGGSMGGSGQLGGEVYQQDPHSMENDLAAIQQPHVPPFPYLPNHFGVGVPLQGLPPQHYQPSFDPNDPEHMMPVLQYYDPSGFQGYPHPRDPAADPKFTGRNSGSYGPRDSNKFGQDAASSQAQSQPSQQGQQPQQSGQSPQAQHYMPVGQYGTGPMYYPYNYGPYQQPQYPPHFQRMLYKQPPYAFPNSNPGYPGPSSALGGYDENYKGSVYGAQMPPFMFPDNNMQNLPKVPSSQQGGLGTSPPKSAFSAGGPSSTGSAGDISSGAFKSQAGDYKGYQNTASNPQSFYNIAPSQSQFNQQQPISFGNPHMLQQPQQPYQQQTRTSQQQY